ncbi:HNH endonuclease [Anaeromyxobacter sp. Fw109-5]|uniref:HNH endonuclease n=1 Tax=Anaeromyxobacter sp. (strain Fw109-5) TaxID=404589 RepID=UPI0002DA78A2
MEAALPTLETDAVTPDASLAGYAAPRLDLPPLTMAELETWFRGGEPEADACEQLLAWAARARGALDLAIGEGLDALRHGDRLAELGYHLDDYAREVLDLGKRSAESLARLGAGLRARPLLRDALRSGRVRIRAAETVLPVAVGEAEALWVERASVQTVRELEGAVRAARAPAGDDEDEWVQLRTHLPPDERLVVDEALAAAREQLPGSTRTEQLEALAQEYLGEFSTDGDSDGTRPLGPGFRACGLGPPARRAAVGAATDRWAELPPVPELAAPQVSFDEASTAQEIDERLRALARLRVGWDRLIGFCGLAVKRSGMHVLLGYGGFRQYVEERLGLPARAVEQRVALEKRLWESPPLQEARRQGVSYEKLRVLARLPETDMASWLPRALGATCITLKREVEGERERQMRARQKLLVPLPRRVAVLLAAAIEAVRGRFGRVLSTGTCLAVLAFHFLASWRGAERRSKSRSKKVRERDQGWCQVPGCSHRAAHSHHIDFRSHGGSDDPENQVGLCAFHHLRCIHGGFLRVFGRAPDGLTWRLGGRVWRGPPALSANVSETATPTEFCVEGRAWTSR